MARYLCYLNIDDYFYFDEGLTSEMSSYHGVLKKINLWPYL